MRPGQLLMPKICFGPTLRTKFGTGQLWGQARPGQWGQTRPGFIVCRQCDGDGTMAMARCSIASSLSQQRAIVIESSSVINFPLKKQGKVSTNLNLSESKRPKIKITVIKNVLFSTPVTYSLRCVECFLSFCSLCQ